MLPQMGYPLGNPVGQLPKQPGIYHIYLRATGDTYVGQARNLRVRKSNHLTALKSRTHSNPHLQNLYNKYGSEALEFDLLEVILEEGLLNSSEYYWWDLLKPSLCLNQPLSSGKSFRPSEETLNKLRKPKTDLHKQHMRETRSQTIHPQKGKPLSDEHRKKISIALGGSGETTELSQQKHLRRLKRQNKTK